MKTLLSALIWVFVGIGAISAVTAYFVPTTLDAELFRSETEGKSGPGGYLLLSSPVGPDTEVDGKTVPMYPAGTELTGEVLSEMSAVQPDGEPLVKRVHIPEFAFTRWSHRWWFMGSVVLLTVCGLVQRQLGKGTEVRKGAADPVGSLRAALDELVSLRDDLGKMASDEERLEAIVHRVGELQQGHMANFGDARGVLISRHGMGGFASIMDSFAGAERKINRSWSAAADRVLHESVLSLEEGIPLLEETERRMGV